jgi:Ulp1 family protease
VSDLINVQYTPKLSAYSTPDQVFSQESSEILKPLVQAFGYQIEFTDLNQLTSGSKLNDKVINFYMKLLCFTSKNVKCVAIDSLLISKILSSDLRGISKCFSKYSDLEFQILLFPLFVKSNHWSLLIFDTRKKIISFYDSIYQADTGLLAKISLTLAKYICQLNGAENWPLKLDHDYPKQSGNDRDCGAFICLYAKHHIFDHPFNFSQADIHEKRIQLAQEIRNSEIEIEPRLY